MVWMTVLKIIFVVLLCLPLAYAAVWLYGQLMKYLNQTDRPGPARSGRKSRHRVEKTKTTRRSRPARR